LAVCSLQPASDNELHGKKPPPKLVYYYIYKQLTIPPTRLYIYYRYDSIFKKRIQKSIKVLVGVFFSSTRINGSNFDESLPLARVTGARESS
jgi:hypothetical protein